MSWGVQYRIARSSDEGQPTDIVMITNWCVMGHVALAGRMAEGAGSSGGAHFHSQLVPVIHELLCASVHHSGGVERRGLIG